MHSCCIFESKLKQTSNVLLLLLKNIAAVYAKVFDSAETLNSHKRIDHSQEVYHPPAGVS